MAKFRMKLLLERIRMPISKLELEGGIILRDSTPEDLKILKTCLPPYEYQFLIKDQWEEVKVLEQECEISLQGLGEFQCKKMDLHRVLTALRILKSGTLGYRVVVWEPLEPIERNIPIVQSLFTPHHLAHREGEYRLEISDVNIVQQFWKDNHDKLWDLEKLGPMKIAVSRFEGSYSKQDHVDKFIDLMISMEALFAKKDEKRGLANKMARRASLLLESDRNKRRRLRKRIEFMYRLRNKLVHGASLKVKQASEANIALELKEYVRQSIKKLLPICSDDKSIERRLAELDRDFGVYHL